VGLGEANCPCAELGAACTKSNRVLDQALSRVLSNSISTTNSASNTSCQRREHHPATMAEGGVETAVTRCPADQNTMVDHLYRNAGPGPLILIRSMYRGRIYPRQACKFKILSIHDYHSGNLDGNVLLQSKTFCVILESIVCAL
jgi:hypothetical protein